VKTMVQSAWITHNKHANHRDHTDHNRKAVVLPSTTVREVEDRVVYVATWSQNPQWYDDDEDS
jgi:hypothetical protein